MSEEKMEWENAEERLVEGYKEFDLSVVYVLTAIFTLLLWMFVTVVVGTSLLVGLVLIPVFAVLGFIVAKILKGMLL